MCWCTPVACSPSHHLASPARASVVRSASQWCTAGWPRSFPAPTSTASPATAPPLLAAPPARPADRAQLHAGGAGGMGPGREGERPCRRLALLQPEAQLPVTRVGEQGAPPRRVGRLLSGCGARPPPQSPVRQVPPGQGGRAHPLAPLKVRAFHAGGLGSGPGPGPPPPKNLPSRRLTLSGVLYPSRQEWSSRWGLTGRSETGCASRWIECRSRPQPSAAPGQVRPLLDLRSMIEQSPTSCYGRRGPATFTFSQREPDRLEPTTAARFVGRKTWVGFGS